MFYLTGGDPLARPDFFDIISYLHSKYVPMKMMGTPHRLSREIIQNLQKFGVKNYQLSLDGLESKHDWFRGTGSFGKTINAIKLLKDCSMPVVVMFTLSKKNIKDLPAVFDLCCNLGVDTFAFARFAPQVNSDNKLGKEIQIVPAAYRKLLDLLYHKEQQAHSEGCKTILSKKDHLWKLYFFERGLWTPPDNPDNKIYSGCHVGRASLTVLADGTVYACRRFDSPVGDRKSVV